MADPPIITTAAAGPDRVPQAATLYASAFRTDPVITYMLSNLAPATRAAYLPTYFTSLLTAATLNAALFSHTRDYSSCLVLLPPNRRVDNPWTLLPAGILRMLWRLGLRACWRMLGEYGRATDAVKAKGLRGQSRYYYVFFLATAESCRGQGLSSALIRCAQERARAEGVPLWLEATTEYSWGLYASLGFETVERVVLGEGVAAADGTREVGGPGVPVWGMVWWPEKAA
ncbi:hypothetical protein LTR36_008035 [Oleoguttula mirabilis]|uniref:N-acetyltransferase domain-containing protein n=1 Tax=Oleoguttula mirabilis TaxID=1507867 RepID=A0AAV9J8L3_9PEZI|nr:hypothetical protein LTR36_008035 [Oleoguttula mirabilis]